MNRTPRDLRYEPPPGGFAHDRSRPRARPQSRWQEPDDSPVDDANEDDSNDNFIEDDEDAAEYEEEAYEDAVTPERHQRDRSHSYSSHAGRRTSVDIDETGFIPWAGINLVMVWVVRALAVATIYLTTIGSVAAFHSGGITDIWNYIFSPWDIPDRSALLYGVVSQLIVTLIEYWRNPGHGFWIALLHGDFSVLRDHKLYVLGLGTDVVLTAIGYNPAAIPWLEGILTSAIAIPISNWLTSQMTHWTWVRQVLAIAGPFAVTTFAWIGLFVGSILAATWPEGRLVRR